jgi:predicted DNA-binding transcriptional regulator YafY
LHRRPQISSELSPNTYEFISTKEQLEYYFFSFGKDAEILEPQELRDVFTQKYNEALQLYQ